MSGKHICYIRNYVIGFNDHNYTFQHVDIVLVLSFSKQICCKSNIDMRTQIVKILCFLRANFLTPQILAIVIEKIKRREKTPCELAKANFPLQKTTPCFTTHVDHSKSRTCHRTLFINHVSILKGTQSLSGKPAKLLKSY